MSQSKKAYFQGTEEPSPKKKKYKSEPALVVQPRFKEPFYRNYDLYDTSGEHGPGSGYHHMFEFKSVKDFLNNRRKKIKNKYKADDSWKLDDGTVVKKNSQIQSRSNFFNSLIKLAIDFSIDEQITPIIGDTESYYKPDQLGPGVGLSETFPSAPNLGDYKAYSTPIGMGGILDKYTPLNDFEGKSPDQLDFGRDYVSETNNDSDIFLEELYKKYLSPAEPPIFGMPDGISPSEDLDSPSDENPQYGILGPDSDIYSKMWI